MPHPQPVIRHPDDAPAAPERARSPAHTSSAADEVFSAIDARRRRIEQDRSLFERYRETGDLAARDALVERFLPLAHHLARRYAHGSG